MNISDPQCQSVTQANWIRGFRKLSLKSCFLGVIFPIAIFTRIFKFQVDLL